LASLQTKSSEVLSQLETQTLWGLEKDRSIKHLLLLLSDRLGEYGFAVSPTPDLNYQAISLCHPLEQHLAAYIYTYGQSDSRFAVHLEFPEGRSLSGSVRGDVYENLTLKLALDILHQHFDLGAFDLL
jgi:hypothetical protein